MDKEELTKEELIHEIEAYSAEIRDMESEIQFLERRRNELESQLRKLS